MSLATEVAQEQDAKKEAAESGASAVTYLKAIERCRDLDEEPRQAWRAEMAVRLATRAYSYARLARGLREGTVSL